MTYAKSSRGEAAIEAATEETFDLILTDIHMPGLDGIEATQAYPRATNHGAEERARLSWR